MMRLKDKVIIVTGSCTGIGKAIARRCVQEGGKVVVHGLENHLGEELVNELGPANATLLIADINLPNTPAHLVQLALQTFGRLDAVVNNAALIVFSDVHTTDSDLLYKVLMTNAIAPFLLIQAALPFLSAQKGSVLNIGSVNAWCGEPGLLAYSMSKGAMTTLSRNLGDSLMREAGVRVNQINPGWVLTEKERQLKQEQGMSGDWYLNLSRFTAPAGRLLTPEEIATAAVYWLSDECGPISGQVLDLEQYPLIGRNLPK